MRFPTYIATLTLALTALAAPGRAEACNAPSPFSGYTCTPTGKATPVCAYDSSTHDYTCDVATSNAAAQVTVVDNYPGDSGTHLEAWGTWVDSVGATQYWCCDNTDYTTVDNLVIQGSQYGDTLGFRDASNAYDIASANVSATCYGGSGNDTIRGSFTTNSLYTEYLYGDYDDDTILAADGDDYVYGGGGNDILHGGGGADVIEGDVGNDTIYGDGGDDTIYGQDSVDFIEGGAGNDTLDGGAGGDYICDTGSGTDVFIDGDPTSDGDQMWDSNNIDNTQCGGGGVVNTRIRGGMTVTSGSCTGATLSSIPMFCP